MRFLVTGTAGFIGLHVARELLKLGHTVHRSRELAGILHIRL
ncbi:NAD-dependent epimerase/dehydratase family protein [Tardiphaga sp. 42S5]|nr:NAD-dependent epimerase/dehydratase family protein [Tardiphaga sp. 42S5]WPO40409.1 NAD-dependent epimerase/dehydratase family protein [Tardiphaga sp. 42S5]